MTLSKEAHRIAAGLIAHLHGPAGLFIYARDNKLSSAPCYRCGWTPHIDGECIVCGSVDKD